jgi:thiamine-phosphate pyrophosphorylase
MSGPGSDSGPPGAQRPILCLVTDRRSARRPLAEAVSAALAGGVDWIQVREKDLDGAPLLELCDAIRAAASHWPAARVLVNRRLDVALAGGLHGVHLGFDGLPASEARSLLGEAGLVGLASHGAAEARSRCGSGASYTHLAPIFAPRSKRTSRAPLGLAALGEAARGGLPVFAQGGISPENAADCVRAGARGVAVTGALLDCDDPAAAASALRAALDRTPVPTPDSSGARRSMRRP